ncbi:hypothetical protein LXA43DRAFT_1049523 [Ganoderma leucocontextum]|nr:hypothetical protein LXA43DRAFT_1049523 [Ganoderma leucocontextum]
MLDPNCQCDITGKRKESCQITANPPFPTLGSDQLHAHVRDGKLSPKRGPNYRFAKGRGTGRVKNRSAGASLRRVSAPVTVLCDEEAGRTRSLTIHPSTAPRCKGADMSMDARYGLCLFGKQKRLIPLPIRRTAGRLSAPPIATRRRMASITTKESEFIRGFRAWFSPHRSPYPGPATHGVRCSLFFFFCLPMYSTVLALCDM